MGVGRQLATSGVVLHGAAVPNPQVYCASICKKGLGKLANPRRHICLEVSSLTAVACHLPCCPFAALNQPHIVEFHGLTRAVSTTHLETFLLDYVWGKTAANIKWVDDEHALAVFPSADAAQALLEAPQREYKVRPYSKASRGSLLIESEGEQGMQQAAVLRACVLPAACGWHELPLLAAVAGLRACSTRIMHISPLLTLSKVDAVTGHDAPPCGPVDAAFKQMQCTLGALQS
jgi:hypothetical protein